MSKTQKRVHHGTPVKNRLKVLSCRLKLDSRPIGLREIYDLIKKHPHAVYARVFSCDVIETRIAGGGCTKLDSSVRLCGLNLAEEISSDKTYSASPNEFGRREALRLLDNGVTELSLGPWSSSPISFRESFLRSEQAKHLRDHIAALVVSERDDVITSVLYYRVLLWTIKDNKGAWKPTWLRYSENKENPHLTHEDAKVLIEELSNDHCIHKFEVYCYMGWKPLSQVVERCMFCHEERARKPTKAEQAENTKKLRQGADLHAVYHRVCKRLEGLDGFEAIEEAEKLAKKYKAHVQLVGCDDDAHSSSSLLLVDHENEDHYMGTSVIYLPQCMGTRATFFLYPGDREELINALKIVRRKTLAREKTDGSNP